MDQLNLSDEQSDLLQQFQSITGIDDVDESIQRLKARNWNLEASVNDALDFSDMDAGAAATSSNFATKNDERFKEKESEASASASAQTDTSFATTSTAQTTSTPNTRAAQERNDDENRGKDAARPRIFAASGRKMTVFGFITTPLFWGFRLLWTVFSFTVSFLPFGRSYKRVRATTNPTELAKEFKAKFTTKYGEKGPKFYEASYSQSLERAKQNLQYFLVYLHSEGNDDTDVFCKQTLIADTFVQFIAEKNILIWGGNVRESEAFKVASTLGATRYPFMALIAYHDSLMKVVHRFEGICPPEECIDVFTRVSNQLDPTYVAIRAERANRNAERSLREQQDAAYQLSLKADREKMERLRQEREAKEREEEEAKLALQELEQKRAAKEQRKKDLIASLAPEPDSSVEYVTRMNIRLPSGARLIRKFDATSTLQTLYDFVETNDLSPIDLMSDFVIVNTYPRKEYRDKEITFQTAGLYPNATVLVEEVDQDD